MSRYVSRPPSNAAASDTSDRVRPVPLLVRLPPELHSRVVVAAKAARQSLNAWVLSAVDQRLG
jgi:predicted HicB family RNase H-like nuclease